MDWSRVDDKSIVCRCFNVSKGVVKSAILDGANSIEKIGDVTFAGTKCSGCHKILEELIGFYADR